MMAYVSTAQKMEMAERLRTNMRKFFITGAGIDSCLREAPPKALEYMDGFFQEEVRRRDEHKRAGMIRNAGFPSVKDIGDYDLSGLRMPSSMGKEAMLSLDFIRDRQSLIMYGVCGSGKTMLAVCLGMMACNAGFRVRFATLSQLAVRLKAAAADGRLENCLNSYRSLDLLVIDEWGYCQLDKESAGYVFQVIADSYERKSLIVTTNLPFSEWGKIVADEQLAAAIIDRIVHYGHLIGTGDKDWRLTHSPMNRQTVTTMKGTETK
jgi:DNA replication protein DnaC